MEYESLASKSGKNPLKAWSKIGKKGQKEQEKSREKPLKRINNHHTTNTSR
jgi:hypothetical protein